MFINNRFKKRGDRVNDKVAISVIVPVYNVELYLSECLDSILKQKYDNFELILVDDGSTDNSGIICDEYCKKNSKVKVIHKANEGPGAARNSGLKISNGEYVCFIDSDDYISDDYLKILYENAVRFNADVSQCGFISSTENEIFASTKLNIPVKRNKKYLFDLLTKINSGYDNVSLTVIWNKLIRREIAKKISFPAGIWHEDEFYITQLVDKLQVFIETPTQLYFYRHRPDSITGEESSSDPRHLAIIDAFKARTVLFKNVCDKETYRKMVAVYRSVIIEQYYRHFKIKYSFRIKVCFIGSFFQFPILSVRKIKGYIIFMLSAKKHFEKYRK